jgi:hypothetical protein
MVARHLYSARRLSKVMVVRFCLLADHIIADGFLFKTRTFVAIFLAELSGGMLVEIVGLIAVICEILFEGPSPAPVTCSTAIPNYATSTPCSATSP